MTTQHEADLKKRIPRSLKEFGESTALTGTEIEKFKNYYDLPLTVLSHALGVNTAALYGKKKENKALQANVSLLLRLYSTFDDLIPNIVPPTSEQLISKIREAEPGLPGYVIGPALGLEVTSGHRFLESGQNQKRTQTTCVLAWLIYEALCQDLDNWELIKKALIVEAAARGVPEPENVLRKGGWRKNVPLIRKPADSPDVKVTAGIVRRTITKKLTKKSDADS